jgi:hypothetical protein
LYQWEQKMSDDVALPLEFTEAAANKVKHLIADEDADTLFLNGHIPFVHLIVEGEAILETAATAAGNIHVTQ